MDPLQTLISRGFYIWIRSLLSIDLYLNHFGKQLTYWLEKKKFSIVENYISLEANTLKNSSIYQGRQERKKFSIVENYISLEANTLKNSSIYQGRQGRKKFSIVENYISLEANTFKNSSIYQGQQERNKFSIVENYISLEANCICYYPYNIIKQSRKSKCKLCPEVGKSIFSYSLKPL